MSAAFYLALLGHKVTVYDRAPNAGGLLRYALPEYRLPKKIVDKEIAFIRSAGFQFKFKAELGKTLQLDKLAKDNDAVFLALGTWEEQALGVPGDDAQRPAVLAVVPQRDRVRQKTGHRPEGRRHRRRQLGD